MSFDFKFIFLLGSSLLDLTGHADAQLKCAQSALLYHLMEKNQIYKCACHAVMDCLMALQFVGFMSLCCCMFGHQPLMNMRSIYTSGLVNLCITVSYGADPAVLI